MIGEVNIMISARHIHITEESLKILFGHPLHVRNMLNQVGQFATCEVVSLRCGDKQIDNVRIIGPVRKYNQVEVSRSEARYLGIYPPCRRSGDLNGASYIEIVGPCGVVKGNFAVIANRHVHMNFLDASKMNIKDKEILKLHINSVKKGVIDVEAKVSDDGYFEVHLDTDDANAFLVDNFDKGVLYR